MILYTYILLCTFPFQTATSREGHRCAYTTNRSTAVPPPQLPAMQPLGVAADGGWGGLDLQGPGSLVTLVLAGHLQLDSVGGIPHLPSPRQSLQHLRQEIHAQNQLGGLGWVSSSSLSNVQMFWCDFVHLQWPSFPLYIVQMQLFLFWCQYLLLC